MPRASLLLIACILLAAADDKPAPVVLGGAKVDPAVLAPLTDPAVPWEAGDRILIIGDLLNAPNQPELALRIHEALTAACPDKALTVHSLMNIGITIERWRHAARQEIARRPPHLVVLCAGIGDVAAAQAAKGLPTAPETWRGAVADIVAAAQGARAAVVLATPAIYGDKPADGFGFKELEAYADAARGIAAERKVELCELRKPLLEILAQRNAKGSREVGVLSKLPGQLKPEGMDLIAGLLAKTMAAAAARIPWRVEVPDAIFTGAGNGTGAVRLKHAGGSQVAIHYTIDGGEPTAASPLYHQQIVFDATTGLRVLAVDRLGAARNASGWGMALRSHAAEAAPSETLPGLWVEHVALPAPGNPPTPAADPPADFTTWWPNCDSAVLATVPNQHFPQVGFALRFAGYFLAPSDGTYVFATTSDGVATLTIDGLGVSRTESGNEAQGAINLNRGPHRFALAYSQGGNGHGLAVRVALPGQRPAPLPDLLLRRPAARPTGAEATADPAVLAPLIADQVPWEAGDRILIIGDLLGTADQPELALRIHQALVAGRPDKGLVVHALMNHGLTTEQWRDAAKAELALRKPALVVVMTGVGDILATAKAAPPSVDTYRAALGEIIGLAQGAGAAVVVATPGIVGDRQSDGPGFKELEAYAEAARKTAADAKAELCDLRQALLAALAAHPKAAELGILSQAPGRLLPQAMDLVAGQLAKAMASAALRIPWSIEVPDVVFSEGGKAEVRIRHGTPAQLAITYTIDDREPTDKSPVYARPVGIGGSTRFRVLAVGKDGRRQSAHGWIMKSSKATPEATVPESLPGLWVDHYVFKTWRDPIPPLESMRPDFETWWPNTELAVTGEVPNHRWPEENFGLRFTGYFIAPVDGTYVFATDSDDASRLAIGTGMLIKNDDLHASHAEQNAIELTRGIYPLTLLYGEGPGVIQCDVRVGLAGQRLQPLPDLLLRRPAVKAKRKEITFELSGEKDEK